ncbi:hypothetical protein [Candidatus Hodgkinia cicadicola]|uniref:hypothetical protein n=1 Tax=Candidatus Hodgkinia cicadicola TaxID=573658 RepID=UPI001788CC43
MRLPWVSVFRIGGIGLGSKRWRDGVDIWVLDVWSNVGMFGSDITLVVLVMKLS